MTWLDDMKTRTAEVVAEIAAGGYEPDGVGLAFGSQVADTPEALGYGTDLSCVTDCDEAFSEVAADSTAAVGEALQRRLMTDHGALIADPELLTAVGEDSDYGFNLLTLLSVDTDPLYFARARDFAAAECEKDDRVIPGSAVVELTTRQGDAGIELDVRLYAELVDGGTYEGVFTLTKDNLPRVA